MKNKVFCCNSSPFCKSSLLLFYPSISPPCPFPWRIIVITWSFCHLLNSTFSCFLRSQRRLVIGFSRKAIVNSLLIHYCIHWTKNKQICIKMKFSSQTYVIKYWKLLVNTMEFLGDTCFWIMQFHNPWLVTNDLTKEISINVIFAFREGRVRWSVILTAVPI